MAHRRIEPPDTRFGVNDGMVDDDMVDDDMVDDGMVDDGMANGGMANDGMGGSTGFHPSEPGGGDHCPVRVSRIDAMSS